MSYTPPAGNGVGLVFADSYTPPAGNAVALNFAPLPANIFNAGISGILDDVSVVIAATAGTYHPVTLAGVLDNVSVIITTVGYHPVTLAGSLDDVSLAVVATAVTYHPADFTGTLDDCLITVNALWEAGVFRGKESSRSSRFTSYEDFTSRQLASAFQTGEPVRPQVSCGMTAGQPLPGKVVSSWTEVPRQRVDKSPGWSKVPAKTAGRVIGYTASPAKQVEDKAAWELADNKGASLGFGYSSPPHKWLENKVGYVKAFLAYATWASGYGIATRTFRKWSVLPWEVANPHTWIWGGWINPTVPWPPYYTPDPELHFCKDPYDPLNSSVLVFGSKCKIPLITRVTIVIHTVNVVRLPDLINVPALSAVLQFDIDSWAWGVSLNLRTPQAIALLEPIDGEPRQVRIEIDGIYIHAIIEEWGESRQFGETTYTASGRSPLALLAQPFAPIRSYLETTEQTAAQLIDHELLYTGWSASYHTDLVQLFTTDWLVSAGAWSYQNKSPIDAIVQIANAAGARAYADRTASLVHIAPRYPVSPWDWVVATPDKSIPLSLVRSMSTQLSPQPNYNQIYISGQSQGVLVSAVRQGTAGDKPAPMVTDTLITHVNAGRERARNILSNTGRQSRVTLDLPLNQTTGLLEPGRLIEVLDTIAWRGLVTGINITAAHGAISQRVEIERHY